MKKITWRFLALLLLAGSVSAQNTNLDFLILGASMNYVYEGDGDGAVSGDGRGYMMDLDPQYQAAHTNYIAWKSNNMDRLIGDWTNGTLSANDQQYIRIIQADYLYRANYNRYHNVDPAHCEQYFTDTVTAGEAAMRKGFRGEPLTTNDWEDLRLLRMQDDVQNIGPDNMPYMLGMTYNPLSKKSFIGTNCPVLRLPKLETVLARSNYTDGVRVDPPQAFYDRGTNRYARRFSGYTTNGAAPYDVRELEMQIPPGETTNDFVEIGAVRNKPMVLIPAQLSDGFWWEYICHDVMPVYNAYRDVADFYFVQIDYHDTSSGVEEYFGANAGKNICVMDMETSEEMAAEAKNQWMTYPWFAVPTLVDVEGNRARNAFATEGGDAYSLIVDVDGNVAYTIHKSLWGYQYNVAVDFENGTAWANLMERELRKVLDNNGKYVPTNVTDWTAHEVGATVGDRHTALLLNATVKSVNAVSNVVTVSKAFGSVTNQFTVKIGPDTRLSNRQEVGDLSTFAPGDTVTVKFWQDTYTNATYTTNRNVSLGESRIGNRVVYYEMAGNSGDGEIHHPRQLNEGTTLTATKEMAWAVGTLESVSTNNRQITVSLNADTNAMLGWQFWKEAGTNAVLWGDAIENLGVISQWVESVQSGSNWTFVIDDGVDIFINADNAAYAELVPGGRVGLLYRTYQNGKQTEVYPEVLRLSEMGQPSILTDKASMDVPEGGTNSFQVRLSLQPESSTTVTVSRVSGDADISVQSGSVLTFTTNNWDAWQTVILSAAQDADFVNSSAVIRCSSPVLLDTEDLTATEVDDEVNPTYSLPWQETFENDGTHAGTLGSLDAQHGWIATGATVTNSTAQGGTQSAKLSAGLMSHTFVNGTNRIRISFWAKPVAGDTNSTIPAGASAVFYVNTNGSPVAYSGATATVISDCQFPIADWSKVEIESDYVSKTWSMTLNGTNLFSSFGFYSTNRSVFGELRIVSESAASAFVDTIALAEPVAGNDADSDGIPNEWEQQYFGTSTGAVASATAANGANTVLECYIAGLDPTNPDSIFELSSLRLLSSANILQWQNASGRVYTIYWTSNLLSGFPVQPFASNIAAGAFTDAVHGANAQGFYKIKVQLDE